MFTPSDLQKKESSQIPWNQNIEEIDHNNGTSQQSFSGTNQAPYGLIMENKYGQPNCWSQRPENHQPNFTQENPFKTNNLQHPNFMKPILEARNESIFESESEVRNRIRMPYCDEEQIDNSGDTQNDVQTPNFFNMDCHNYTQNVTNNKNSNIFTKEGNSQKEEQIDMNKAYIFGTFPNKNSQNQVNKRILKPLQQKYNKQRLSIVIEESQSQRLSQSIINIASQKEGTGQNQNITNMSQLGFFAPSNSQINHSQFMN